MKRIEIDNRFDVKIFVCEMCRLCLILISLHLCGIFTAASNSVPDAAIALSYPLLLSANDIALQFNALIHISFSNDSFRTFLRQEFQLKSYHSLGKSNETHLLLFYETSAPSSFCNSDLNGYNYSE